MWAPCQDVLSYIELRRSQRTGSSNYSPSVQNSRHERLAPTFLGLQSQTEVILLALGFSPQAKRFDSMVEASNPGDLPFYWTTFSSDARHDAESDDTRLWTRYRSDVLIAIKTSYGQFRTRSSVCQPLTNVAQLEGWSRDASHVVELKRKRKSFLKPFKGKEDLEEAMLVNAFLSLPFHIELCEDVVIKRRAAKRHRLCFAFDFFEPSPNFICLRTTRLTASVIAKTKWAH